jgi:hypothetical protein
MPIECDACVVLNRDAITNERYNTCVKDCRKSKIVLCLRLENTRHVQAPVLHWEDVTCDGLVMHFEGVSVGYFTSEN